MININRTYAVAAHDVLMAAISFILALILRWGPDSFIPESIDFLLEGTIFFTGVCVLVFWRTRIYRGFWRYASLQDVINIGWAVSLAVLIFLPILFVATRLEDFPRSALFINWFILLALLLGPRLLYRAIVDGSLRGMFQRTRDVDRIPVILVGAGDDAELFIRSTTSGAAANYKVVGLIDDEPTKVGQYIRGVKILGNTNDLPSITKDLRLRGMQPQRLIMTFDAAEPEWLGSLLRAADGLGLPLSRLPRLTDFRNSDSTPIEIKPIAIEDLLGRPQTSLDMNSVRTLVKGKTVCVTGAGGTIGYELCRQIAELEPNRLVLIDNSEYNLYSIDQTLKKQRPTIEQKLYLRDVRDTSRMEEVFEKEHPNVVFHAAALKHVPMVESNPNEGALTNIIGTRNIADACIKFNVNVMVLISTDKAVNPTNIMGATKRVAESYCQALGSQIANKNTSTTRIMTVRFGNVLGSSGSVVPLFQKQIAEGGPLTVTHKDVTRYFMTTKEAVQLVLQAAARESTTEKQGICVLDMGNPVRIDDLARQMIRLAGHTPDVDIKISYTGLRPGEKMFEELFHGAEPPKPTSTPGILLAKTRANKLSGFRDEINRIELFALDGETKKTCSIIKKLVPEYNAKDNF